MTGVRTPDPDSVADLVVRARSGEQHAWNGIVDRFAPLVWAVCRRYALTGGDADDACQSTWLRLIEHLPALREPAALPGWIVTTTKRECLAVLRAKSARVRREQSADADAAEPPAIEVHAEELLLMHERHAALRAAFRQLPDQCRRLLELLLQDPPPSYAEVGRRLNVPVGGLGPTRARCLDKLRRTEPLATLITEVPE